MLPATIHIRVMAISGMRISQITQFRETARYGNIRYFCPSAVYYFACYKATFTPWDALWNKKKKLSLHTEHAGTLWNKNNKLSLHTKHAGTNYSRQGVLLIWTGGSTCYFRQSTSYVVQNVHFETVINRPVSPLKVFGVLQPTKYLEYFNQQKKCNQTKKFNF